MVKVVAFNGSVRKDGNTAQMIEQVFEPLRKAGIETELVQFGTEPIRGCIACYKCIEYKNKQCVIGTDKLNEYVKKMADADAIILGSPTYFADVTANMKALIERAGMVGRANEGLFRRKVGAAVVSVRRGGAIHVFHSLNSFFTISEMVVVGSNYWNIGVGRGPGEVQNDEEGMTTMTKLGENMSWLLGELYSKH